MKPSEFKISISVESYDEITAEIAAKIAKNMCFSLPKSTYFPSYQRYQSKILISEIEDLN